jgi:putative endopeptidase
MTARSAARIGQDDVSRKQQKGQKMSAQRFAGSLAAGLAAGMILGLAPLQTARGAEVENQAGIDIAAMDTSVSPCENFYRFACGTWIAKNPLPADRSRWSRFDSLGEGNVEKLRRILEAAAKSPSGERAKIGDHYASCMDEAAIEAKGLDPLRGELDRIAALGGTRELPALLAHLHEIGVSAFFTFGSGQYYHDASKVIARVDQGGLALGDRDYYLKTDPRSVELRAAYVRHVANMFRLLGNTPEAAGANADQVVAIETALATASLDRVRRRDPKNLDHAFAPAELAALTGHFAWDRYLAEVGSGSAELLNVGWPEFFTGLDSLLASADLAALKNYLRWHLVTRMAGLLPKAFVDENFAFFGKTLTGAKVIRARWKRCVEGAGRALGEDLGQAYVEEYFPPATKAQTVAMIGSMAEAFEEDLRTLDWMSEETRQRALAKLKAMVNKVGYPDRWRDYSVLRIERGDALGNAARAASFEFKRRLDKIGRPVDRAEWGMTPPTVNAYYSPRYNDINFPAGILQPPFFDAESDLAANYGAIGAVMGHEMSHAFDDEGRHFDGDGNLKEWWSAEDSKAFEGRAACLVLQYGGYTAVGDVKLNGRLTLGENIADNGGVRLAFAAFRKALARGGGQSIGGFTPEQRFFIGYAQIWCGNETPEDLRRRVQIDPHSPGEFRVNGVVANEPEFAAAFKCPVGAPMAPPRDRVCRVW